MTSILVALALLSPASAGGLAGVDLRPEVFEVLVELTRLDVVPTATAQVLKSLCVKSAMRASVGGSGGATAGGR